MWRILVHSNVLCLKLLQNFILMLSNTGYFSNFELEKGNRNLEKLVHWTGGEQNAIIWKNTPGTYY